MLLHRWIVVGLVQVNTPCDRISVQSVACVVAGSVALVRRLFRLTVCLSAVLHVVTVVRVLQQREERYFDESKFLHLCSALIARDVDSNVAVLSHASRPCCVACEQ